MKIFYMLLWSFLLFNCSAILANDPLSETEIKELKKTEPDLWYADSLPTFSPLPPHGSKISSEKLKRNESINEGPVENFEINYEVINFIKWLLIIAAVAGIFYLIIKGDFKYNFKNHKNEKVLESIIETTKIETTEQLQSIGFEQQIKTAELNKNYRLATRLYYLWTLKKLIDADFINFSIQKTNQDYRNEIAGNAFHADFNICSNYYNYVWFGEFAIDENTYLNIAKQYTSLLNNL